MANYPEEIGLVIDPKYFGSIGAAGNSGFYSGGHTLTHEMGHFFGLKHIWGQGTGEAVSYTHLDVYKRQPISRWYYCLY